MGMSAQDQKIEAAREALRSVRSGMTLGPGTGTAKEFVALRSSSGLAPVLRLRDGQPRITDEGHLILDVRVPGQTDIAEIVAKIGELAGVVETGFFPTEATEAIIATSQGVRRMTRNDLRAAT
jgi:ribose 5-phosphate isomerase